ncbi:hypothetical protein JCM14076_21110 [Methylosoma difficile]
MHNKTTYYPRNIGQQRGAVTLLTALMLLMGLTLMTLTTSRTNLIDLQITGNDIRSREAKEAAEAGLEYGIAWGSRNLIATGETHCPNAPGCPALEPITGLTSGETYQITDLVFNKSNNFIKVTSTATGSDANITATAESFIAQARNQKLFKAQSSSPPPWVIASCITTPATGNPGIYLSNAGNPAVISGTSANSACLPAGHLNTYLWTDDDLDGVKEDNEQGANTPFITNTFSGCPGGSCAWLHTFDMSLADAKQAASDAGHVFSGSIPCGASAEPSIYVIDNSGSINRADISGGCLSNGDANLGTASEPVLIIVPASAGCPTFNGGITIYGIVYYETTSACASQGWGGASVYGSVIWEGNVDRPNANSVFVESNYGNDGETLDSRFKFGNISQANRLPGTWKDF